MVNKRKHRRMKVRKGKNGAVLVMYTPKPKHHDPETMPASKADMQRILQAVDWPPGITRNVYGQRLREYHGDLANLMTQKGLSVADWLAQHNALSLKLDMAGRNYFSDKQKEESDRAQTLASAITAPPRNVAAQTVRNPQQAPLYMTPRSSTIRPGLSVAERLILSQPSPRPPPRPSFMMTPPSSRPSQSTTRRDFDGSLAQMVSQMKDTVKGKKERQQRSSFSPTPVSRRTRSHSQRRDST